MAFRLAVPDSVEELARLSAICKIIACEDAEYAPLRDTNFPGFVVTPVIPAPQKRFWQSGYLRPQRAEGAELLSDPSNFTEGGMSQAALSGV
jgi:hypothetical protein